MSETFCNVPVKIDSYNGLTVDLCKDNNNGLLSKMTNEEFEAEFKASMERWIKDSRRCIWFRVPSELSNFIPIIIKNNFEFHHAQSNFVMLIRWMDPNEPTRAPKFAHTTIGVGGIVYQPQTRKVLLIQEKNPRVKMWKFPGGYSESKEDIGDTAIREVLEETGIKCSLKSIISFRHGHNGIFGCSDFYFVCLLVPICQESVIKTCQFEIDDCQWFDLLEARKQLCGFNHYVFEEFLKQYSLLEYEDKEQFKNINYIGQTIDTEIINSKYGPYERKERVYSVRDSKLIENLD